MRTTEVLVRTSSRCRRLANMNSEQLRAVLLLTHVKSRAGCRLVGPPREDETAVVHLLTPSKPSCPQGPQSTYPRSCGIGL